MTATPSILLGMRISDQFREALANRGRVLGPPSGSLAKGVATMSAADRAEIGVVITMGTIEITEATMACLPALRVISCLGSGYEGVDVVAARKRNIVVTHSPAMNASAVADLALGLMIASIRRMFDANAYLRRGDWTGDATHRLRPVRGLTGRKVGIYGLGAIGERIASRVEACEMEVAYHNRRPRLDVHYAYHASLLSLAAWCDVLIIAVRADATNRHTVNAQVLAALGPRGHVVNIARGAVIDEAALIAALSDGTIEGAGLDVYEHEPDVPEALLALSNVALTPHIGGGSIEAQAAMKALVVANLDAFLAGEPVPTPVAESAAAYPASTPARAL